MSTKRELIQPHQGDKRYMRRDEQGQFTSDQVDVGRSPTVDRRRHPKKISTKGTGQSRGPENRVDGRSGRAV
jgi:hypothetical protein